MCAKGCGGGGARVSSLPRALPVPLRPTWPLLGTLSGFGSLWQRVHPKPTSLGCLVTRGRQLPDCFPARNPCERGCVHGLKPSAPPGRSPRPPTAPVTEEPWPGQAQAHGLAFCLLSAGDAIPTMKPSSSPSSSGHQYKKFSFEGTTGLSHASGPLQSGE